MLNLFTYNHIILVPGGLTEAAVFKYIHFHCLEKKMQIHTRIFRYHRKLSRCVAGERHHIYSCDNRTPQLKVIIHHSKQAVAHLLTRQVFSFYTYPRFVCKERGFWLICCLFFRLGCFCSDFLCFDASSAGFCNSSSLLVWGKDNFKNSVLANKLKTLLFPLTPNFCKQLIVILKY